MAFPLLPVIWTLTFAPAVGSIMTDQEAASNELKLDIVNSMVQEVIKTKNEEKEYLKIDDIMAGMQIKESSIGLSAMDSITRSVSLGGIINFIDNVNERYSDSNTYHAILEKEVNGRRYEYSLTCNMQTQIMPKKVDSKTLANIEFKTKDLVVNLDECELENIETENSISVLDYKSAHITDDMRDIYEKEILRRQSNETIDYHVEIEGP